MSAKVKGSSFGMTSIHDTNYYERDCRKKKRDQKSGTTDNKKNDSTIAACDGDIIIACDDACVSLVSQQTD